MHDGMVFLQVQKSSKNPWGSAVDTPSVNTGEETRHRAIIDGAVQLFVVVSSHTFGTSSGRTARLGKLLLHYCLLRMDLLVQKLGRQLPAVFDFYLLEHAASPSLVTIVKTRRRNQTKLKYPHTHHVNDHFPGEAGLAACPINSLPPVFQVVHPLGTNQNFSHTV